jgi:hypothetical protein
LTCQLMNRLSPETKAVMGVQGRQFGLISTTLVTEPKELPESSVDSPMTSSA